VLRILTNRDGDWQTVTMVCFIQLCLFFYFRPMRREHLRSELQVHTMTYFVYYLDADDVKNVSTRPKSGNRICLPAQERRCSMAATRWHA
jgi:hypothetical protein